MKEKKMVTVIVGFISGVIAGILISLIFQFVTPENEEKQVKKFIKQIKKAALHEKQDLKKAAKRFIDKI